MSDEAWPTPQQPSREPLPRIEDLPIAEQGYEPDSVRAAFDSFYRHAAQLDAALRTLEAVDSFHRQAAALRSDLRVLRTGGWTQQTWPTTPAYGYGMRAAREGISPAVWRIAGEVAFLIVVSVVLGVAKLSWWVIVLVMAAAFLVVALIEWASSRDFEFARGEPAPVHPIVEGEPFAERAEQPEPVGWAAFEEAQEPSDAMTMIGGPPAVEEREAGEQPEPVEEPVEEAVAVEVEAEHLAEPEAEPEHAEEPPQEKRRRWWKRHAEHDAEVVPELEVPPRHVRVLASDAASDEAPGDELDPWERGFDDAALEADAGVDPGEDTAEGEPALAAEGEDAEHRSH
jgi:hypothetical protein